MRFGERRIQGPDQRTHSTVQKNLRGFATLANGALAGSLLCALCLASAAPARAVDMTGAWATDVSACDKMFARTGSKISFRSGSHRYGTGFILDNDRLRGRIATCKIKWREGETELSAACSGAVLDTAHFTLKVLDGQKFSRVVPGKAEPEIYQRCWP